MVSASKKDWSFSEAVDAAVMRLVQREHFYDRSIIKLPILLADGATLVVEVWPRRATAIITDASKGYHEASIFGAETIYKRQARKIAEDAGIKFSDTAFTIDEVSFESIAGAVVAVADCTKRALDITMTKVAEKKYEEDSEELYTRLASIFEARNVERDAAFAGASNHKWQVSAIVRYRDVIGVFEPVANHHNSIASVVTKFHDIAYLEHAPKRISVVNNTREFGDMLPVLAQASTVIERQVPDSKISSLLAAA